MLKWVYEHDVNWHTAIINDDRDYVMVYKTAAGDYAVSAARDDDPGGGEVEFEPSLVQAKKHAERIVREGTYKQYMLQ